MSQALHLRHARLARDAAICVARLVLLLLISLLLARTAFGQATAGARLGVVMPSAYGDLYQAWSDTMPERAWCVTSYEVAPRHWTERRKDGSLLAVVDTIYRVWGVAPAPADSTGATYVEPHCKAGQPVLHTHQPGPQTADCQPSWDDADTLAREGQPFGVVWCDVRAFRFYYRDGDRDRDRGGR